MARVLFLLVAGIALAFIGCSSDGGGGGSVEATIFCQTSNACVEVSADACLALEGQLVKSCKLSPSSSSGVASSSSGGSSNSFGSSSSVGGSSSSFDSSSSGGSSSSADVGDTSGTFTDDRDDQIYRTVKIGDQVWMAENLNYNVDGSKCYGDDDANCAKYGRLYDWVTAMALSSSCNSLFCASQVSSRHRGICPEGWHLPSDAGWTQLVNFVGSTSAGIKLKSVDGWNTTGPYTPVPGTDDYGFSALPGGYGASAGGFNNVGINGFWWSATESSASNAWRRDMSYSAVNVNRINSSKNGLFSVRCIKD
ncbi:MAG: fibrobacter succinogenes major paralogous domain-containing protein [Fibromonadaceae bacterium]|jgi:uncharacterized protein (TIGR02145 family)|nr:fibrobacter succinogenes major paralogous domain-containing protein [Fibromonadaceae bacterium]